MNTTISQRLPQKKLLLALLAGMAALPLIVPSTYYLNILVFAGINVLLALGLNLVMGYTGQVSLGHAAFYGFGAYASGVLTAKYGVNPWLAMGIAVVLTGLLSLFIGLVALRLQGYFLSMATLGFGIILHILFVELPGVTGGPSGLTGIPGITVAGVRIGSALGYYYLVWTAVGLALLCAIHLVDSRTGRALRAIQGDETAAALSGINTLAAKVQIFVVAGCLASIAGSLYAHYVSVLTPESFGFTLSIELIVMVIIGGIASIWGSLVGALLLTLLPEYLRVFHDYDILIYGLIVILVVMFVPRGIAGDIEFRVLRSRLRRMRGVGK